MLDVTQCDLHVHMFMHGQQLVYRLLERLINETSDLHTQVLSCGEVQSPRLVCR